VKPSEALALKRAAVREATQRFRATNPRVFASVVHGTDEDGSDLDVIVDALQGTTLFPTWVDCRPNSRNYWASRWMW